MSESPSPTLTSLSFSSTSPDHFVHIINNLLTASECTSQINAHQSLIPSNVTIDTIRDREVFDDESLAALLWSRLEPFYANDRIQDEEGQMWTVKGLNNIFRLCRYLPKGKFAPHFDGRRLASMNEQSFMTVNMYLNTVPPSHKGATRILSPPTANSVNFPSDDEILAKVQPELGSAAVFRDSLWHDGEELVEGEKYLLRTDVLYEREVSFDFDRIYIGLDDEGKGRRALRIAEALEDARNSEEAVQWYKRAFRLSPGLERDGG